ncbi:MAG TPA: hypothetical protein VFN30_10845, partial [Chitinophagaceae bacterium]|nr:hypothetical protein [Chitinophagaceae bacterium]
ITSTGKRISNVERNQKRNSLSASTAATLSDCQIYEICLYERYCEEVLMGDNWTPTGNCTPWEPTGYCFYEEYCGTGQCDYGSSQSCECQLYGIGCDSGGGGGGSGGDSECLNNCTSAFNALYTGSQVVAETISFDISTISDFTKYKNPKWRILKNLTWSLYSQEYGVVRLVDSQTNKWQWESLVHGPITKEGFTPGGTVTFTQGVGTPTFTPGTQNILYAGMSLNFDVTYSPICDCLGVSNIIPSVTVNYTANALWEAKP